MKAEIPITAINSHLTLVHAKSSLQSFAFWTTILSSHTHTDQLTQINERTNNWFVCQFPVDSTQLQHSWNESHAMTYNWHIKKVIKVRRNSKNWNGEMKSSLLYSKCLMFLIKIWKFIKKVLYKKTHTESFSFEIKAHVCNLSSTWEFYRSLEYNVKETVRRLQSFKRFHLIAIRFNYQQKPHRHAGNKITQFSS